MMFDAILLEHLERASVVSQAPAPAHVTTAPDSYRPLTAQCFYAEAVKQDLEPLRLLAVLKTENGRIGEFSRNSNGSYDIGPMQINTINLPELSSRLGIGTGKLAQLLAYDGCFNVAVGAWYLRRRTNEANGDFWYGIGFYHSRTPQYRNKYILQVHKNMTAIVGKINQ